MARGFRRRTGPILNGRFRFSEVEKKDHREEGGGIEACQGKRQLSRAVIAVCEWDVARGGVSIY